MLPFLPDIYVGVKLLNHRVGVYLIFKKLPGLSQVGLNIIFSDQQYGSSGCFTLLPAFGVVCLLHFSHSNEVCNGFDLHFPNGKDHVLRYRLMTVSSISFWEELFELFASFLSLGCLDFIMLLGFFITEL